MATNWVIPTGDNRHRVHEVAMKNALGESPIVRFHTEKVFVDENDAIITVLPGPTWTMVVDENLMADAELAPHVAAASAALEAIAEILHSRQ